jgi:aminomethyltransferase
MTSDAALRRSPLHDRHERLGARFASFGGWSMPLEFPGGGVVREHLAVRSAVGVFDVSHLGKGRVSGPGAAAWVDARLTNDLGRISTGHAQYTLCCDDETGGVVDDLLLYLRADDDVFLVPNAANNAEVLRRLSRGALDAGVRVTDQHDEFAVIAVQGPQSPDVLTEVGLPSAHDYMTFVDADWHGGSMTVCRSGYTGEHGYELVVPAAEAGAVWDAVLAAARDRGGLPCGLGARDTLRTEMGYPLHGQDISLDVTPVQARLTWAVGWKKPAFWGRDVLLAEREHGPARRLRGLRADGRAIPRPHMPVTDNAGRAVGTVTSGTFSATLRTGIGLALLAADLDVGAEVLVDVRGRPATMTVQDPPFVSASPR